MGEVRLWIDDGRGEGRITGRGEVMDGFGNTRARARRGERRGEHLWARKWGDGLQKQAKEMGIGRVQGREHV